MTRRSCHGNSYNLYIRSEVEYFASTVVPPAWKVAEVEAKRIKALKKNAPSALASVDAQLEALLKKKAELESLVVVEKPKAKRGRPAGSTVSTSRKKAKNNYGSDDDESEADENNNFSVGNIENADAESGSRRSGRTERKRYSDPGEDDDVY